MKHSLIILISILLLSSPVIGDNHKGETLYRWKNPSGDGYVWKGFGDKETHPVYKGDVKNGKPNGLGILLVGGKFVLRKYVGEWKDGKENGKGKETFPDGGGYEGGWKNGLYNGHGTLTLYDIGLKYVGEYKDGLRNGHGTLTLHNGTKSFPYFTEEVGEWKNNREWNITIYDKYGTILRKYVNGKVIVE